MTRTCLKLTLMLVPVLSACASEPMPQTPTTVRTIQISDWVTPDTVYAKSGEEIRWQNLRTNPVRVGFLSRRLLDELGCNKGVTTLLGEVNDLITIGPGKSVSLCPIRSGVLQYNVWFDAENPRGAISRTATVHVEGGG